MIDLRSQAEAVMRHVQGWSKREILDWLGCYGEVAAIPTEGGYADDPGTQDEPEGYGFHSHAGLDSGLWFYRGGTLALATGRGRFIRCRVRDEGEGLSNLLVIAPALPRACRHGRGI